MRKLRLQGCYNQPKVMHVENKRGGILLLGIRAQSPCIQSSLDCKGKGEGGGVLGQGPVGVATLSREVMGSRTEQVTLSKTLQREDRRQKVCLREYHSIAKAPGWDGGRNKVARGAGRAERSDQQETAVARAEPYGQMQPGCWEVMRLWVRRAGGRSGRVWVLY